MPIHNSEVSDVFRKVADLLEIQGANEYRIRAYRDAAQSIDNLSSNLEELVNDDTDLTKIPGIGKA